MKEGRKKERKKEGRKEGRTSKIRMKERKKQTKKERKKERKKASSAHLLLIGSSLAITVQGYHHPKIATVYINCQHLICPLQNAHTFTLYWRYADT